MSRKLFTEKGQALILIVLVITAAAGMVGLGMDAGHSFSERRQAQNAADAAAIAAAYAKIQGGNVLTTARTLAAQNGYVDNQGTTRVAVYNPPVSGNYSGDSDYIQVVIDTDIETWFAQIVGVKSTHNTVEAISHAMPSEWKPMYEGNALVALKTTGKGAFRSHGDNNTNVYGAGIFVNSNDACAFEQMGNSVLNVPDAAVRVVGNACLNGSISPASSISTGMQSVPYPPASLPEEPVCTTEATQEGDELTPGNWEGSFPPRGVTFLRPGIYCIDGTFMMNAHEVLRGDGVLLYMRSGNIHWNGLAEINLTGYTTAPYPGLLIYMPMSNDEGIILNGNSNSTFAGSILAPASDVQINGTERSDTYQTQIVAYTIDLIGTMDLNVNYNENIVYHHLNPANLELVK